MQLINKTRRLVIINGMALIPSTPFIFNGDIKEMDIFPVAVKMIEKGELEIIEDEPNTTTDEPNTNYQIMKKIDLVKLASDKGLIVNEEMNKAEIIALIKGE